MPPMMGFMPQPHCLSQIGSTSLVESADTVADTAAGPATSQHYQRMIEAARQRNDFTEVGRLMREREARVVLPAERARNVPGAHEDVLVHTCKACFVPVDGRDPAIFLPCAHGVHLGCMQQWCNAGAHTSPRARRAAKRASHSLAAKRVHSLAPLPVTLPLRRHAAASPSSATTCHFATATASCEHSARTQPRAVLRSVHQ